MPLSQIIALLKDAIGLDVDSVGRSSIERIVKHRVLVNRLKSMSAYLELARESAAEFQELVEGVLVPETWFFRNPEAFAALRVIAADRTKLRLLSVPCATGEEPYSIAMTLLDAGLQPGQFEIDAVDISPRFIAFAREGIYGRNSFRSADMTWRERYFTSVKGGLLLNESVRARVKLRSGNLLDPGFLNQENPYDIIFCRNLLIYFDAPTQARAAERLRQLLAKDGLLFVGPAEPSLFVQQRFFSAKFPMAFAFRKEDLPKSRTTPPAVRKRSVSPPPPVIVVKKKPTPAPKAAIVPVQKPDLETASRLADEGRFKEAEAICENSLRESGDSARAFYLLGLVKDVSGDKQSASQYYRKTLYLDPSHYEALMHLSFLSEKSGDRGAAALLKNRAQRSKQGAK